MPLSLATPFRSLLSSAKLPALTAFVLLAAAGLPAQARGTAHHRHPHLHAVRHMLANVGLPGLGMLPADDDDADDDTPAVPEDGKKYELHLTRQTGEALDVVYRVGDTYIPDAVAKLSAFLHDSHNEQVKNYDPRTFDVLHTMLARLDRSSSVIQVLCGYRTQETNDALRASHTTNAAEHSQHIEGTAVDLRVPGVPAAELRDAALSLGAGGVGYYPRAQFIHVDTGPVREWTYGGHTARKSHAGRRGHRGRRRA